MEFARTTLENCHEATGTVVVIDVLRAFTTACYAFHAGVEEILLVYDIDEALAVRDTLVDCFVMGEDGGRPIQGFDYDNSPAQFVHANLRGKRLIQRTSNGVQGVIRSSRAERVLAGSFVCAGATVDLLRARNPESVTFVITGWEDGEEDAACADYMEALLRAENPDPSAYLDRVWTSWNGRRFSDPAIDFLPAGDLPLCTALDRFDFAMEVKRQDGLLHMKRCYA
ncbi:MAG: 2-phosphosulfolactate phosphatase [Caldilineaceae bacterium]